MSHSGAFGRGFPHTTFSPTSGPLRFSPPRFPPARLKAMSRACAIAGVLPAVLFARDVLEWILARTARGRRLVASEAERSFSYAVLITAFDFLSSASAAHPCQGYIFILAVSCCFLRCTTDVPLVRRRCFLAVHTPLDTPPSMQASPKLYFESNARVDHSFSHQVDLMRRRMQLAPRRRKVS